MWPWEWQWRYTCQGGWGKDHKNKAIGNQRMLRVGEIAFFEEECTNCVPNTNGLQNWRSELFWAHNLWAAMFEWPPPSFFLPPCWLSFPLSVLLTHHRKQYSCTSVFLKKICNWQFSKISMTLNDFYNKISEEGKKYFKNEVLWGGYF